MNNIKLLIRRCFRRYFVCKSFRLRVKQENHGNPMPFCSGTYNKNGFLKSRCKKCIYRNTLRFSIGRGDW